MGELKKLLALPCQVCSLFGFLQSIQEPDLRNQRVRMESHTCTNLTHDCSFKDWRKVVLEQMYQSLCTETQGALQDCIRDALVFNHQTGCTTSIKVLFSL